VELGKLAPVERAVARILGAACRRLGPIEPWCKAGLK
jgi:hypothetical protein